MGAGDTGPKDLGRVGELDPRQFELGSIIWGRFGVVSERRIYQRATSITVEDLQKQFGQSPSHTVTLCLLDTPVAAADRVRRAWTIKSPMQARVLATLDMDGKLALICTRRAGTPLDERLETAHEGSTLERAELLGLATALATLLTELHEAGVTGIQFDRSQLWSDENRYVLDGFAHLLPQSREPRQDVAELVAMLGQLSGPSSDSELVIAPDPATARELLRHLQSLNESARFETFEFPADPPFVGRTEVLASLDAGIAQAQIAKPTTIIVRGERGVGKSRLLTEFVAHRLAANDVLILTGVWHIKSADTKGALLSALEQLTRILPTFGPDERDDIRERINHATKNLGAIVARSAPALGNVLYSIDENLPQLELGGEFSRHTAVIADVLKSLGTRKRPLLLVLDNVENIDANSAAVLNIIGQNRPAHHTCVILGLRTKQDTTFQPDFGPTTIDLVPLTVDEVGELLTRTLPGPITNADSIAKRLWKISDGVPLTLGATLRLLLERGRLFRGPDGSWHAHKSFSFDDHPSLRDLLKERLDGADASVQRLLLRLTVFGNVLQLDDIRALGSDIDVDVEKTVDDLRNWGILTDSIDGLRFPHDTIREFVLDYFDEAQHRLAHRYVAALLTERSAPLPQIVYHRDFGFDVENETPEASDKLSRLHIEAGRDRLNVYDLERARWHLERALENSHDLEPRAIAGEGLADVCLLQDDLETAVALYTALIATADPGNAARIAAKAVQFLYSKSANSDARQLGLMALEMATEPTPTNTLGKLWLIVSSIVQAWFGEPTHMEPEVRVGLCRLYPYMLFIALIDDPVAVLMYWMRMRWVANGLETGSAAFAIGLQGAIWTVMGRVETASQMFNRAAKIAREANDPWAEGQVFHNWGGALLSIDRYTEGQDRLDDGIAAFRETGDVSFAILSMMSKCIYGFDREHADKILGWLNEALSTARRNGTRNGVPPLQSMKLHLLARQGQATDLEERLHACIQMVDTYEMPGIERVLSRIHIVYVCLELTKHDLALEQVRIAQEQFGEMGAVPDFFQDVHFVSALTYLARGNRSRTERKALLRSARKFRRAIKRLPRLWVTGDLLEMKLAVADGNSRKAHTYASKIVSNFETHENLHAARQAHRTLARLLKGENVLAAAEHERVARNFGRRLGLADHVLLSDFSEIGRELGIIALTEDTGLKLEETQSDIPAAGMLSSSAPPGSKPKSSFDLDLHDDVLEVWALDADAPSRTVLRDIIESTQLAIGALIGDGLLEISSDNPDLDVPISSGDLEILLINMLLASRDGVGSATAVHARLNEVTVSEGSPMKRTPPGQYLCIEVSAKGTSTQIPVIGAFSSCESLATALNGILGASTERGMINLVAHLPLNTQSEPHSTSLPSRVIIVHPEKSVRDTIGDGLSEIGVKWKGLAPLAFEPTRLEQIEVIFADTNTLRELRVLQPLLEAKIVEIVKPGVQPSQQDTLRVPFALSELKEHL